MKSRHLFQVVALVFAGLAAAGCNEESQPAATEAVTAPCRCLQALPAAAQPPLAPVQPVVAAIHPHRHLFSRWRLARARFYASESETVSESEDYTSSASSSDRVYEQGGESESTVAQNAWADGFGRRHFVAAGGDAGWQRANDDRARFDPWHGYNVDCPQPGN